MAEDQSAEFLEWKRAPDRSVAGAVLGLVLAWIAGGYLTLAMVTTSGKTASMSGTDFSMLMLAPPAAAGAACGIRRVRYWAGAFVPGATAGWLLGCLTFLLLALLSHLR